MQPDRRFSCGKASRSVLAVWLVAWMLFSSLLSASPVLHEHFHENAAQPSHQCAVTLLEQQQLLASDLQTVIVFLEAAVGDLALPSAAPLVSQSDLRLLPSRGPPFLS